MNGINTLLDNQIVLVNSADWISKNIRVLSDGTVVPAYRAKKVIRINDPVAPVEMIIKTIGSDV